MQSLLVEHLPQAPVEAQKGAVGLGHAPAAAIPLSPAQLAHVSVVVLQTGVVARQAFPLPVVHSTHWLAEVSQAGVAPEQSLSLAHCPQMPWLAPVAGQMLDLHAEPLVHGPSPVA